MSYIIKLLECTTPKGTNSIHFCPTNKILHDISHLSHVDTNFTKKNNQEM
uniref:Uncharacterized protein n=1 Tax=Rhizophora mucronata TaxID=61149 RepID=A0A2P2R308_RHIMU